MTITEYTPAHFSEIEKLVGELQDELYLLEPEIVAGKNIARAYAKYFLSEHALKRGKVFIARKEDEPVGLVAVRVEQERDEQIAYLFVSDLVVTQNERNRGIGTQLLQRAEQYAQEIGVRHMKINTLTKNPGAHRLYQKAGFRDYASILYKKLV